MLWRSMEFMREASDAAAEEEDAPGRRRPPSSSPEVLFEYLKALLARFGVFLPIRSGASPGVPSRGEKGFQSVKCCDEVPAAEPAEEDSKAPPELFLLPGLMAPEPPPDVWTYKAKESWSATLCHSWLLRGTVPPGTMERATGAALRAMFDRSSRGGPPPGRRRGRRADEGSGPVRVHQVMVWRTAFLLRAGMDVVCPQTGERTESVVELFGHLAGAGGGRSPGPPCVASDSMGGSMRRLTVSAKGQAGDAGRKIWDGGFDLVTRSVHRALQEMQQDDGTAPVEREIVCPDCLSAHHPCEASTWTAGSVRAFAQKGHGHVRCGRGHRVETGLLFGVRAGAPGRRPDHDAKPLPPPVKPVGDLLGGVVVVGLWDGKAKQIRNVGSGFVADREKGLIVTASHILFNMQSSKGFGKPFYGMREAKAVIGVIPKSTNSSNPIETTAVFRYFAEIVAHDVHNIDACVLRITTKFEQDVGGEGEGCGDQPEIPLKNNTRAMKAERLHQLKLTKKCELEENVRILGYNQGGEGRLKPGAHVNRCVDFARGYVCKKFKISADERAAGAGPSAGFRPLEETVVMCPTISGHSGGPCVNQEGAVIGILSRADPADGQRCYLVPASELKRLLKKARAKCTMSPLDLYYMA